MKNLVLILILTIATSCSHMIREPSSDSQKPRHLVITVHGLSGNAETFGYFSEATTKYLSELTPKYQVESMNFLYPTGKSEKNGTYDFAMGPQGLGQFIKKQFADRPLGPQDKISLVCHSQGGLVSYIWFFNTILAQDQDFEYVKHVDSIITLGTPFWGTKISSILTDRRNPDIIPFIKLFAPANFKMTRREISDLAYGSDTVNTLREAAVRIDSDPALVKALEDLPVRLVNITGLLPKEKNDLFAEDKKSGNLISGLTKKIINLVYKIFTKSYSGETRIESDIAVPVPSSRWNFIYAPTKKITQDTEVSATEYKDFSHLVQRSKFIYTESAHLPFDTENTLSMAYVNKMCLQVDTCDHPTYRYIIEQLANCKTNPDCDQTAFNEIVQKMKVTRLDDHQKFKSIKETLQSFAVHISLRLNPGQIDKFPVKYFKYKQDPKNDFTSNEVWEFNEYSLENRVLDLNKNKITQESVASTADYKIILADKNERRSVDIVSKLATTQDPFDYIRINVTGYIRGATGTTARSYVVPIDLKLPDLPAVKLNVMVQPSYSTFTYLDYTTKQ